MNKSLLIFGALATLMLLNSCITTSLNDTENSKPMGSFALTGPTFGKLNIAPTSCDVGQRQFFLGFDFVDQQSGLVTRLVVDPVTGPVARVFKADKPYDSSVIYHRTECKTFHFSLDTTGWIVNHIQMLNVSIELDCQLPSGDRIIGNAKDSSCL